MSLKAGRDVKFLDDYNYGNIISTSKDSECRRCDDQFCCGANKDHVEMKGCYTSEIFSECIAIIPRSDCTAVTVPKAIIL